MGSIYDLVGFKGCAGGQLSQRAQPGDQRRGTVESGGLEWGRSMRNGRCGGEMHRYRAELGLRGQHTGPIRTVGHKSAGIEQD